MPGPEIIIVNNASGHVYQPAVSRLDTHSPFCTISKQFVLCYDGMSAEKCVQFKNEKYNESLKVRNCEKDMPCLEISTN
jgi:hypothetical protein